MHTNSYGSKEGQDQFVSHLIFGRDRYVDIGASDPTRGNNTWRLRQLGWTGYSFDIRQPANKCEGYIVGDVTKIDFAKYLNGWDHIGYISFDVDSSTVKTLGNFPFERFPFHVMTFEHDLYRSGGEKKKKACIDRLQGKNYAILVENVRFGGNPFEDWWINLDHFNSSVMNYSMKDVPWQLALERIQAIPADQIRQVSQAV